MYVEISTSNALRQDGTLANDSRVGSEVLSESDAFPGVYRDHHNNASPPWLSKPRTYYWMAHGAGWMPPTPTRAQVRPRGPLVATSRYCRRTNPLLPGLQQSIVGRFLLEGRRLGPLRRRLPYARLLTPPAKAHLFRPGTGRRFVKSAGEVRLSGSDGSTGVGPAYTIDVVLVAVCSDVHGRIERLQSFLAAAIDAGAQQCWCLGDVVDALGAASFEDNAACVELVQASCALKLAGNHEAWALRSGLLDSATAAVCASWPPGVVSDDGILTVHGSPRDPWMEFVHDEASAAAALAAIPGWLGLHGHTHVPRLWAQTDQDPVLKRRRRAGQVFGAAAAERLLACPGALTGKRPSFLLVDFPARTLRWQRLAA